MISDLSTKHCNKFRFHEFVVTENLSTFMVLISISKHRCPWSFRKASSDITVSILLIVRNIASNKCFNSEVSWLGVLHGEWFGSGPVSAAENINEWRWQLRVSFSLLSFGQFIVLSSLCRQCHCQIWPNFLACHYLHGFWCQQLSRTVIFVHFSGHFEIVHFFPP